MAHDQLHFSICYKYIAMTDDEKEEIRIQECLAKCKIAHQELGKAELIDLLIELKCYQEDDRAKLGKENILAPLLIFELCHWLCIGEMDSSEGDDHGKSKTAKEIHKPPLGGKTS
jgi:hypothetical protein